MAERSLDLMIKAHDETAGAVNSARERLFGKSGQDLFGVSRSTLAGLAGGFLGVTAIRMGASLAAAIGRTFEAVDSSTTSAILEHQLRVREGFSQIVADVPLIGGALKTALDMATGEEQFKKLIENIKRAEQESAALGLRLAQSLKTSEQRIRVAQGQTPEEALAEKHAEELATAQAEIQKAKNIIAEFDRAGRSGPSRGKAVQDYIDAIGAEAKKREAQALEARELGFKEFDKIATVYAAKKAKEREQEAEKEKERMGLAGAAQEAERLRQTAIFKEIMDRREQMRAESAAEAEAQRTAEKSAAEAERASAEALVERNRTGAEQRTIERMKARSMFERGSISAQDYARELKRLYGETPGEQRIPGSLSATEMGRFQRFGPELDQGVQLSKEQVSLLQQIVDALGADGGLKLVRVGIS